MPPRSTLSRRTLLSSLAAAGAASALGSLSPAPGRGPILTRRIPSTGETLPLVGLGSWITFNVGDDPAARDSCADVMRAFFQDGGRLIDSSPMYGSSQEVIGSGLNKLRRPSQLFAADKVWISSGGRGPAQIEESRRHWGIPRFDLLQVHNLMSWEEHLPTLFAMKKTGRVRYVGVTTSEGRRHDEIERVMRSQPLDFVQVTYNVLDREVEDRILPLARERKIAVITNRPFRQGALIRMVERHPLPAWARDADCANWAQLLLKFIVSHPAVNCAIPATSRVDHARQNVGAAYGRLPDETMRRRIVAHVEAL
jgi:diketogulonate reductase-like aldo/keto reductase